MDEQEPPSNNLKIIEGGGLLESVEATERPTQCAIVFFPIPDLTNCCFESINRLVKKSERRDVPVVAYCTAPGIRESHGDFIRRSMNPTIID